MVENESGPRGPLFLCALLQKAERICLRAKRMHGRARKTDGNMSVRQNVEETVERLLAPIADAHGVRIYDVEYVREGQEYFLRAYIDKDGGVTIDDCVDVSHDLSDALDAADPIRGAYTLEVSSPGLGRRLTKDRHLEASLGEDVEGTTFAPYDGGKTKVFEGVLRAFDRDTVTIARISGDGTQEDLVLRRRDISVLKLQIDF